MKKAILAAAVVFGGVAAAFLALRSMEPKVPSLPKEQMTEVLPPEAPPASEAPTAVPGGSGPSGPSEVAPQAGLEDFPPTIRAAMADSKELWPGPDAQKTRVSCLLNPRPLSEKYALPLPRQDVVGTLVADMLCSGNSSGCGGLAASAGGGSSGSCPNPPCVPRIDFGMGEGMEASERGCRRWVSQMLFIRSALRGSPDREACRAMWEGEMDFSSEELARLCPLLAADYVAGSDSFCREIASKPYAGQKIRYAECEPLIAAARGEAACKGLRDGASVDPTCQLKARYVAAVKADDPGPCGGDYLCSAALGTSCGSGATGYRANELATFCTSAVRKEKEVWIVAVDSRGQNSKNLLAAFKERVEKGEEKADAELLGKIDVAMGALAKAVAAMEKERAQMNVGGVSEGEVTAPPAAKKSPAKRRSKRRSRR